MKSVFLALLALFLIVSCKKGDVTPPPDPGTPPPKYYSQDPAPKSSGMVPMSQVQYSSIGSFDQGSIDGLFINGRILTSLPERHTLYLPQIINQRDIPASAAFAVGYAAKSYNLYKASNTSYYGPGGLDTTRLFNPLFIYNQLDISKRQNLADIFDFLKTAGISNMQDMPFFYDRDTTRQPTPTAQSNAVQHKVAAVYKLKEYNVALLKKVLYDYSYPIVVGITIDNAFKRMATASFKATNTYDTGSHKTFTWIKYMENGDPSDNPASDMQKSLHTMVIAGWDDTRNAFLVWNSWGALWGNGGYMWIDYDFMKEALYYFDNSTRPLSPYAFILAEKRAWRDGLVAGFHFNQNTEDLSGHGNRGTLSANVVFDVDRKGDSASRSIKFKGSSAPGEFRIPNAPSLHFGEEASVSFWVRVDSVDGTDWGGVAPNTFGDYYVIYNFFSKSGRTTGGYSDSNYDGLASFGKLYYRPTFWGPNINLINFFYGGAAGNYNRPESGLHDSPTGKWHHIVNVFRKNGSSTLYMNGMLAGEREIGVFFDRANTYDLVFNQYYKINGAMDDIYVYNYALGVKEVTALYRK